MNATLDAFELPTDLVWIDEFDWTPVEQSEQHTLTGGLIIDSGIKQAGRPMTLKGGEDAAWVVRENLKTLYAKLDDDASMTLTLGDGRVFTVRFDHKNQPIESQPIIDYAVPEDADNYTLTVRFIIV